jgi:hypothetical protein
MITVAPRGMIQVAAAACPVCTIRLSPGSFTHQCQWDLTAALSPLDQSPLARSGPWIMDHATMAGLETTLWPQPQAHRDWHLPLAVGGGPNPIRPNSGTNITTETRAPETTTNNATDERRCCRRNR